jgi:hypothetical protein
MILRSLGYAVRSITANLQLYELNVLQLCENTQK